MERIRRDVYNLLTVLFVGAIVAAGSIVVFRTTLPKDMPLSEDGFYEIYTAYDYERFWRKVESQDFIDGRLMSDITLNDLSGYEGWELNPPVNQSFGPETFAGEFDGNGHVIYGLYTRDGYGLVKKNKGTISGLTLRDGLIVGKDEMGGFCLENAGLIQDCVFEGRLRTEEDDPGIDSRMGGICGRNGGSILKCGYRGTMTLKAGWRRGGVRAGICCENRGLVEGCYNLVRQDYYLMGEYSYAIADRDVKDCFVRQEPGWGLPEDTAGGITELDEEGAFYLPFAMRRGVEAQRQEEPGFSEFPQCIRQGAVINGGKRGEDGNQEREEASRQKELWAGKIRVGDNRILGKRALADGQMQAFVSESFQYKEENWRDLELEPAQALDSFSEEGAECVSALKIRDTEQGAGIFAYSLNQGVTAGEEYTGLWEICGRLLEGQGAEEWEHDTWLLLDDRSGRPRGSFILYRTQEGSRGFFFGEGGLLFQVKEENQANEEKVMGEENAMGEEAQEKLVYREEIESLRNRIMELPLIREGAVLQTEREGLWEGLLWSVWEERLPGDGICWQDDEIKNAAYCEAGAYVREVLPIEEITGLESLWICNYGEVKTLADLQNFPKLKRLWVQALEVVAFDLTPSMTPRLEELSIEGALFSGKEREALSQFKELKNLRLADCGLEDLAFLEGMTELTELSLEGNHVKEISSIGKLEKLKALSLRENEVEDIVPLTGLTQLRELDLGENGIGDITALGELTGLGKLRLDHNQIRDISPLAGMKKMGELRLHGNLIGDFAPLLPMKELHTLSVEDNLSQNIGEAVFTPMLTGGRYHSMNAEELRKAQAYLDRFYPEEDIMASELAEGDLNGDGIADVAVTGVLRGEEDWRRERNIYLFLGRRDGGLGPITPLETAGIYGEEGYGDFYQGMLIAGERLVVCLGGYECDFWWNRKETYCYRDGRLVEDWCVDNEWFGGKENGFTLYHREKGIYEDYVIARDGQGYEKILLISEENSRQKRDGGKLEEILDEGLGEIERKAGYELPEVYAGNLGAAVAWDENSEYVIRNYPVKTSPVQALGQAAEELLEDALALPVTCYTSAEIKENRDRLAGVELPREFYMGWMGEYPAILSYDSCNHSEDGGYVHCFALRKCNEKHSNWIWGGMIYFYEDTGKMVIE